MAQVIIPILFSTLFFFGVITILNKVQRGRLQEKVTKKYKKYYEKP